MAGIKPHTEFGRVIEENASLQPFITDNYRNVTGAFASKYSGVLDLLQFINRSVVFEQKKYLFYKKKSPDRKTKNDYKCSNKHADQVGGDNVYTDTSDTGEEHPEHRW